VDKSTFYQPNTCKCLSFEDFLYLVFQKALHLCRWHWCSHVHSPYRQKWISEQHDDHHLYYLKTVGISTMF